MKRVKLAALLLGFVSITSIQAQRNPNNPNDRTGEQHNYLLDAFFKDQTRESIGNTLTMETLINFLCGKQREVECSIIRQSLGGQLFRDVKGKSLLESEAYFIEKGYVTARHGYYIQLINDIIEEHLQDDYMVCYKAFLLIEDQLMNDPDLSSTEKSNLLYASSVARYSAKFWKDVETGVLRYPSIGNPGGDLPCCSWLKSISTSDVKGAVAGGLVSGGPGSVVSGAGSSIGSAVTSLWHSFWND